MIGIRHPSTATASPSRVTSDIDADITSPARSPLPYSVSDGTGRIDLLTNGWIIDHEINGDMLVGTIESTDSDVTLLTDDTGSPRSSTRWTTWRPTSSAPSSR